MNVAQPTQEPQVRVATGPEDTIVAVASGPGRSPRTLIRVSGPATRAVIARCFSSALPTSRATAAHFMLSDAATLPVLLLRFEAPHSYTGEDALELLVPGNPHLVDRVMRVLLSQPGVREATPGEFSARAYLHGKLTLDQAEGVAATIAAASDAELAGARRLLEGESGRIYRAWADELAHLLALVEAGVDFSDQEDVIPIAPRRLRERLDALAGAMTAALGSARGSESPDWFPTVVLAGAPNAGKSTLFNALLGWRRAITSPIAGTTRDVLQERLSLSPAEGGTGLDVLLTDLAGLDDADRNALDAAAQERSCAAIASADVVLWCDPSGTHEPAAQPRIGPDAQLIRVQPKADQVAPASAEAIAVCALDGRGLAQLRAAILRAAWGRGGTGSGAPLLPRHRRAMLAALHHARGSADLVDPSARALDRPELVARRLREALDAAGELVGRVHPDEIIGRIFATFCIGK